MGGIDIDGRHVRKGAAESVPRWVSEAGGDIPADLAPIAALVATGGGTPLVVADGTRILGVIYLKDDGYASGDSDQGRRARGQR